MSIRDEIIAEFKSLEIPAKARTKEMVMYMVNRQEQVLLAQQAGEIWQPVFKQALINVKSEAAKEATRQADELDAMIWDIIWRSWSMGVTSLISKL